MITLESISHLFKDINAGKWGEDWCCAVCGQGYIEMHGGKVSTNWLLHLSNVEGYDARLVHDVCAESILDKLPAETNPRITLRPHMTGR